MILPVFNELFLPLSLHVGRRLVFGSICPSNAAVALIVAMRHYSRGATISSARHNKRNRKNVISVLLLLRFSYLQIKRSPDDDKLPFKRPPHSIAITIEIQIYACMYVPLSVWSHCIYQLYLHIHTYIFTVATNSHQSAVGAVNRSIYVCQQRQRHRHKLSRK